jgi:hypothetical protein
MLRRLLAIVLVAAAAAPALADGNVVAVLDGRTLRLTGDAGSNWIALSAGGATDAVLVTPNGGATVNGGGAATFARVRSIVIDMGAGADRVDLNSLKLRGSLRADLGDGNDEIRFTASHIRGRTTVRSGAGLDLVRTDSSAFFRGPVHVRTDAGNDEIQIVNAQFRNRLRLVAGADDDHVLLQGVLCTAFARAEIATGFGRDFVEFVASSFENDCRCDAGPDYDRVRLATTRFLVDVALFGGPGSEDVLSIEGGNVFGRLREIEGFEEGQPD